MSVSKNQMASFSTFNLQLLALFIVSLIRDIKAPIIDCAFSWINLHLL